MGASDFLFSWVQRPSVRHKLLGVVDIRFFMFLPLLQLGHWPTKQRGLLNPLSRPFHLDAFCAQMLFWSAIWAPSSLSPSGGSASVRWAWASGLVYLSPISNG